MTARFNALLELTATVLADDGVPASEKFAVLRRAAEANAMRKRKDGTRCPTCGQTDCRPAC